MTRILAIVVFALAMIAASPPARADETEQERMDRAYKIMQEGAKLFDLGKFEEAIPFFERAYDVYPYPEALYSLGQCHRKLKDYEKAIHFFKAYLRNAPNAKNRTQVEGIIAEMEKLLRAQRESGEKPPQGTATPPRPDPVPTDPDPHQDEPEGRQWYEDRWGWIVTGAGVIGLGVGAGYLYSASQIRDQVSGAATDFDRTRLRKDADDQEAIGVPLAIVGGVVVAAGIGLLIWNPAPHGTTPTVGVTQDTAWVGLQGAF